MISKNNSSKEIKIDVKKSIDNNSSEILTINSNKNKSKRKKSDSHSNDISGMENNSIKLNVNTQVTANNDSSDKKKMKMIKKKMKMVKTKIL
jgi:hypothetical protein